MGFDNMITPYSYPNKYFKMIMMIPCFLNKVSKLEIVINEKAFKKTIY
jgi:hypothetical protein